MLEPKSKLIVYSHPCKLEQHEKTALSFSNNLYIGPIGVERSVL